MGTSLDPVSVQDVLEGKDCMFDVGDSLRAEDDGDKDYPSEEIIKQMSYPCEGEGSDDDDDESLPFERLSRKMDNITDDGGVKKIILKSGAGEIVPKDAIVRVHYNAYLELSAEPYDSTRLRVKPHKFRLGSAEILTGFDFAVSTMRKGEFSRFLIQPEYSFGKAGCPPRVPPDSTVMMEIELLSFVAEGGVEDFLHLTPEERSKVTFDQVKKLVSSLREEGNTYTKEKNWIRALRVYKKAADILEVFSLKNEQEEATQKSNLLKLYLNMALCTLHTSSYPYTVALCCKALEIDKYNIKAMFRKSQAFRHLSEFDKATEWLTKARQRDKTNADIAKEFELLSKDINAFKILEKDVCKKMFTSPPSEEKDAKESPEKDATHQTTKPKDDETGTKIHVSADFATLIETKLRDFMESEDTTLPFPAFNLTVSEIGYILNSVVEKNLDCVQTGEGYNMKMKIHKKKTE